MLGDLAVELITQGYDKHYRDPRLLPGVAATEIDPAFVAQVKTPLWQAINNDDLIADSFARFMPATKDPELEHMTEEQLYAAVRGRRYFNGDCVDYALQ